MKEGIAQRAAPRNHRHVVGDFLKFEKYIPPLRKQMVKEMSNASCIMCYLKREQVVKNVTTTWVKSYHC